jgi:hypothetical protein
MTAVLGSLFQLGAELLDGIAVNEQQQEHGSSGPALTQQLLASVSDQLGSMAVADAESKPPQPAEQKWGEGATCIACGIGTSTSGFDTAEQQRAHFKTDWHRCARAAAGPGPAPGPPNQPPPNRPGRRPHPPTTGTT